MQTVGSYWPYATTLLIEKGESDYGKIQTDLTVMRRAGELPYDWRASTSTLVA
jgi:hypothetical protein